MPSQRLVEALKNLSARMMYGDCLKTVGRIAHKGTHKFSS